MNWNWKEKMSKIPWGSTLMIMLGNIEKWGTNAQNGCGAAWSTEKKDPPRYVEAKYLFQKSCGRVNQFQIYLLISVV